MHHCENVSNGVNFGTKSRLFEKIILFQSAMISWILTHIDENILDLVEILDTFPCKYSNWLNWFFKNLNDLLKIKQQIDFQLTCWTVSRLKRFSFLCSRISTIHILRTAREICKILYYIQYLYYITSIAYQVHFLFLLLFYFANLYVANFFI